MPTSQRSGRIRLGTPSSWRVAAGFTLACLRPCARRPDPPCCALVPVRPHPVSLRWPELVAVPTRIQTRAAAAEGRSCSHSTINTNLAGVGHSMLLLDWFFNESARLSFDFLYSHFVDALCWVVVVAADLAKQSI